MLVVCPKCFTQYVISNEIKVPEGQKFHCSACGNYFTLKSERQTGFYGDEAASEEEEIPTVSAVMNETNEKNTEVSVPTNTIPETNESEPEIEIKNESNREEKTEPVFSDVDSLALLANETPQASDRLDTLPEAFKPVETTKKKTSALGAIFCLCIAGAICYGTVYVLQQYPLLELTEEFIASKLDKNYVPKTQKEANSSPAANTVAQPAAQPTPSAANEKNKSENSADKPMYIPPAKLDKPIITVDEVSARQEARQKQEIAQKQQTPPAKKETAGDSQAGQQQPTASLGTPQQANQMQKPTQLMAQQAKAQQQTMPSVENEPSAQSAENTAVSEAQKAARLLDEQLEQGEAAAQLENEVAALATERNLMQSAQSEASVSASVESNTQPTDMTAPAAAVNSAPTNAPQAPVPTVPTAPTAPQPTEHNQLPMNNESVPQPAPVPAAQMPVPVAQQADNVPAAQMPVPVAQQADNVPVIPTQAPAVSAAPTETVPLFTVDESEQAKQINTNEANRILKIQDIAYEISQNEAGIMRLMIKGSVANTELTKVVIPQLKAVVYDQNDTPVARKRIILSQPEIDGNSVQSFFSSVVPAPEQVSHVEVVFDE